MVTITPRAAERLKLIMDSKGQQGYALRLKIVGRGVESFQYDFRSVPPSMQEEHEQALKTNGLVVFISEQDVEDLRGAVIDLKPDGGFQIDNENPVWHDEIGPAVARLIAEKINPGVAMHGGFITLVDVRGDTAYVRMGGGCQGCSLRNVTLKSGIDSLITEAVPQIKQVIDITKHEAGMNPYYTGPQAGPSALARQQPPPADD
ncbi:MAG: Fe-S biogenesis protein NfuA [Anaerolineae bacterium]